MARASQGYGFLSLRAVRGCLKPAMPLAKLPSRDGQIPSSAFPAISAALRQSRLPINPTLRIPAPSVLRPRTRMIRSVSGPRFAAIAKIGALRHSSIKVRARAYSTALPQT